MIIKTKQFNNIPEHMIPKLGKDEVAVFVCLHNSIGPGGVAIYPTYSIAPVATIMTDNGPAEIAYVVEDAPEGKRPKIGDIIFETGQKGTIICKGSTPSDIRKFVQLSLHPENAANGGATYERQEPGQKQKNALDKAKTDAQAINLALETPVATLKTLLAERGIKTEAKSDDEIRLMATEEGKRKLFESQAPLIDNLANSVLAEMFEVGIIIWDHSKKLLKNTTSDQHYDAKVQHNANNAKKREQLVAAAQYDTALAGQILADIETYNSPIA